jgi:two-component system NarL family sensor kinase
MEQELVSTVSVLIIVLLIILFAMVLMYQKYIDRLLTKERNMRQMQLEHKEQLLAHVIDAEERERQNIAEDLHDNLTASLNILRLKLYQQSDLDNSEKLMQDLDKCIEISRNISHNLKSPILEKFGLLAALKDLLDAFHQSFVIDIYELMSNEKRLSSTEELHLYRIAQEILVNIIKHANATSIEILWHHSESIFALTMRDNGVGMNENGIKGIGLSNIQARVEYLKARIKINSRQKRGTSITIVLQK